MPGIGRCGVMMKLCSRCVDAGQSAVVEHANAARPCALRGPARCRRPNAYLRTSAPPEFADRSVAGANLLYSAVANAASRKSCDSPAHLRTELVGTLARSAADRRSR